MNSETMIVEDANTSWYNADTAHSYVQPYANRENLTNNLDPTQRNKHDFSLFIGAANLFVGAAK
ncbi:MAG: hypothetical protein AAF456_10310 [Planctomycetota bacterium]